MDEIIGQAEPQAEPQSDPDPGPELPRCRVTLANGDYWSVFESAAEVALLVHERAWITLTRGDRKKVHIQSAQINAIMEL